MIPSPTPPPCSCAENDFILAAKIDHLEKKDLLRAPKKRFADV